MAEDRELGGACVCPCRKSPQALQQCSHACHACHAAAVRFVKSARPAQVCLAKVCIATIGVPLDFRTTKKHRAVGTMELANPNQRLGLTWSIRWLFSTGKVGLLLVP